MFKLEWRAWALLLACVLVLYFASGILLPFVLGAVLAYLLSPMVSYLVRFMPRPLAVLSVIVLVLGGFTVAVVAAVPVVVDQVYTFAQVAPELCTALVKNHVIPLAKELGIRVRVPQLLGLVQQYAGDLANILLGGVQGTAKHALSAVSTVFLLLMTPVVLYYVLKDGVLLEDDLRRLIPAKHRKRTIDVVKKIDASLSCLLRGQLMVSVWLGVFYAVALSVFGLQMGLLIGLATGLMSFIPFVGMTLGTTTAFVVAMMQFGFSSPWPYLWLAGLFAIGQVIEGSFLQPHYAGKALGLHPLWVVFTVLAGGAIGGFLGILIALPLAAVARVLVHEFLPEH